MNKALFTVVFFLMSLLVSAMSEEQKKDSIQITQLGAQSLQVVYSQSDSAKAFIDEALRLCAKAKHNGLFGLTYNYLGIYYDVIGNNDSAFIAYHKAVDYAKKQQNKTTLAASYNNIGLLHWNLNQLSDAVQYFFKAVDIYENIGNEQGKANAYSNISLIFEDQQRPDDALMYARKALHIRLRLKDTLNIGRSYANIGIFLSQKGQSDSGVYYSAKALSFFTLKNNTFGVAMSFHNMATDYHILNLTDSALFYANKALELRLTLGNKKYIAATHGLLGNIYKTRKEYASADHHYRAAAGIYEKYKVHGELWKMYKSLATVNEAMGQHDSALQFLKARVAITDSLYSEEKIAKLYEIEEKFESEKTKRALAESNSELAVKKQQSQRLVFVTAIVVLAALMLVLFFIQQQKRNRETKQRELLLQKLEISRELHDNIGSQLTYLNVKLNQLEVDRNPNGLSEIKQFAKTTISDLRSAIWGLSADINVEDLRMKIASEVQKAQSDKIQVDYDFKSNYDGTLNSITAVNAFRIVQEALQNAVKHASASRIFIKTLIGEKELAISVEDNGTGIRTEHSGFGIKSMKQRADKMNATLTIDSSEQGTIVALTK